MLQARPCVALSSPEELLCYLAKLAELTELTELAELAELADFVGGRKLLLFGELLHIVLVFLVVGNFVCSLDLVVVVLFILLLFDLSVDLHINLH